MICPMMSTPDLKEICLKKECAWWDEIENFCAMFQISRVLSDLEWRISQVIVPIQDGD